MKTRVASWLLYATVLTGDTFAQIVAVPALRYNPGQRISFTTRDRIVLYANVKKGEKYQARMLRGTKASWIAAIPTLTTAGCVEFKSAPFVVSVDAGVVDLDYLRFTPQWIHNENGEIEDTPYVLVLEKIRRPDLRRNLRVKPAFARSYIERGLQVTLRAPDVPKTPAIIRILTRLGRLFGGGTALASPSRPSRTPSPSPSPRILPPPPAARLMDCIDL
jgi:hypothetical protein